MFLASLLLLLQGIVVPPQDAEGWTVINKSPDTQEIYVSSSLGNNSNPGTIVEPLETFDAAMDIVRDGFADHIYMKCGDVWPGGISFDKKGRSFDEPLVITSYGAGPRPLIRDPNNGGLFTNPWGSNGGFKNLWVIGLAFHGSSNDDLVTFMWSSENVLLEDCELKGLDDGSGFALVLDGLNFVLRRNLFHETGQGIYSGWGTDFVLVEQNYFFNHYDNNYGNWLHATYFDNENMENGHQTTIIMNENVVGNVEHTGLQGRCSADITNNTVFRAGVGISLGGSDSYPAGCDYVTGDVVDNVILHGTTHTTPWGLAWGFITGHSDGVNFVNNIIANSDLAGSMDVASPRAISLNGTSQNQPNEPIGVRNLNIIDNIIYNWGADFNDYSSGMDMNLDPQYCSDIVIDLLDIQEPFLNEWTWISHGLNSEYPIVRTSNVRFLGQPTLYGVGGAPVSFADWKTAYKDTTSTETTVKYRYPQLTIPLYNKIIGGGQPTFDDFIDNCLQQRKGNWRYEYTSERINQIFRRAFK